MTEFYINIELVKKSNDFPAMIKALAYQVLEETYVMPGDWFRTLHDDDLDVLNSLIEKSLTPIEEGIEPGMNTEPYRSNYILLMLSMLLRVAEGAMAPVSDDENDHQMMMMMLKILASTESLHRKGLVVANHKNFTFDHTSTAAIATPTDLGKEVSKLLKGKQE